VDQALVSDTVVNIFDEAGIKSPDVSVISDEFLAEVEGMEHKNLAVELLKKLLRDEIKAQRRTNIVQSRKLAEMLEDALNRYKNQVIGVTDILQELVEMSKDVQAAKQRGEELGWNPTNWLSTMPWPKTTVPGGDGAGPVTRARDRPGGACPQKRLHRLEPEGERSRPHEGDGQAPTAAVWLSTGYAGPRDRAGAGAGEGLYRV
jgi:hypothetical protein